MLINKGSAMNIFKKFIKPVYAHCDLPCGVYDPAQARIEAESVLGAIKKYDGFDEQNKMRAIIIKEQRCEEVKRHLWVLWTDYFKPEHLALHDDLHTLFWNTTKQAGLCKKSLDIADAEKLIDYVDEIAEVFAKSKI
jgi:nickel superoxide dismutase